jgi:hypothetical protein
MSLNSHLSSRKHLALVALLAVLTACADGADGKNGADGAAGADGMNGVDGTNGTNGTDGASGMNGTNGTDGMDGVDGMNGADGTNGVDGMSGAPGYARASIYVAKNGATNAGVIERVSESFAATRSFAAGNNEGLAFSLSGQLVQAGDGATLGANLRTVCAPEHLPNGASLAMAGGRELRGAATTLVAPKGIALAHRAGLIFVADAMSPNVRVFGAAAAGDVAPVASTSIAANAWDLAYDEISDRLFVALTNGDISVHDDYISGGFGAVSRTITPSDAAGAKISVNIHGIVYDRASDRLVVSDVGSAAAADDGQIFVINAASSADGAVEPARRINGPATGLGNPVDIILSGADLRVAEKANDTLLVFNDIFGGPSGDVAPNLRVVSAKAESLAQVDHTAYLRMDVSDIDTNTAITPYLSVSSNPATATADAGKITRLSSALNASIATFDAALRIESVTFDTEGDAYATYDDGTDMNGGIFIAGRGAQGRDGESASPTRDRSITGPATGLVAPKGLDIASPYGLIFVAENNATTPGVLVFSACAAGDAAPLFRIDAGARPWDVDFDVATGSLYVALTNGTVAVFDDVLLDKGVGGPDRVITPAVAGARVSVNLHGIDYDPASDSLFISDVGSAANADDGQLFAIGGASVASGLTNVSVRINGPANPTFLDPNSTQLGNPVDVAYDGQHLYVAEKSKGLVLRFDDFLEFDSGNVAPSRGVNHPAPESVALHPAYFSAVKR